MIITEYGQHAEVSFWPAEELDVAFKRVNAAMGKPEELEELRLFVRTMNYFYDQASLVEQVEINKEQTTEICRLAKIGLDMELGITAPEVKV